ncbi:iron uptake porin [Baaleninema simplex]|uniref:iron uptake porin n=1 Tax=Baaleninema simplex TaxID=2862350 RepID=UPI00034C48BA|nr:iron uptake porin [Baaleninema simplex]
MSKISVISQIAPSALVATALLIPFFANAAETQTSPVSKTNPEVTITKGLNPTPQPIEVRLAQVTSVSQLSDVQPTDWAFQALQSLVERYGCIAGYPDGTYRGNNFMTRYEFAAGLNACLDQIVALIGGGEEIDPEDLARLRRLQEEFAAELAALRGRVDGLEARVAELEANQFSTTTKLNGEVIFSIANAFNTEEGNEETVFQNRVRLDFVTSFTGRDRLLTRLQSGSSVPFGINGNNDGIDFGASAEGVLASQVFGDSGNSVNLYTLAYSFPVDDKFDVTIAANGVRFTDFTPTLNPYFDDDDGGNGSLSAFGQHNPIYRLGGGAGLGLNLRLTDFLQFTAGYLAGESSSPLSGDGLFNGDFAALGQLTLRPNNDIGIALTYNYGYFGEGNFAFNNGDASGFNNTGIGFTGTAMANGIGATNPITSHSFGVQVSWALTDNFHANAWGGYTDIELRNDDLDGEIWNWALGLAFPNLLLPGNLGGIVVGSQPYLGGLEDNNNFFDNDVPWHVEGFYRVKIGDNLSVTPGFVWLVNPNQDADNDDAVVGTIRGTFTF